MEKHQPRRRVPVAGTRRPSPYRRPQQRAARPRTQRSAWPVVVAAGFLLVVAVAFLSRTHEPPTSTSVAAQPDLVLVPAAKRPAPRPPSPVAATAAVPVPAAQPATPARPAPAPAAREVQPAPSVKAEPPRPSPLLTDVRLALEAATRRLDARLAARDFARAKSEALTLLGGLETLKREDLSREFAPHAKDAISLAALFEHLVAGASSLADRTYAPAPGVDGKVRVATTEHLEVAVGPGVVVVPWAKAPAEGLAALFGRLPRSAEESYALAVFCQDSGLEEQAHAALRTAVIADPGLQGRAFGLVARWTGIAVPEGGFVFHAKRWVTVEERRYALLDDQVGHAAARLRSGDDAEMLAGASEIATLLSDGSLRPEFVERSKAARLAALRARREAKVAEVRATPAVVALDRLKELKRQLNAARSEALRTIRDTKIYPDEDHGRIGQPAVDAKVKAVRTLWERPLDHGLGVTPSVQKAVDSICATDGLLLSLGAPPAKGEDFEALLADLNRRVDLRGVTLDDAEKAVAEYNKRVWAYNAKVQTSMTRDEVRVVTLVNEYREMMGMRILEAEDHLAQAARGHSKDMEARGFFAHENPDGKGPAERCQAAGYASGMVGENIAMGYGSPDEAHNGWYNSSGHHRNMLLDGYTQMGCGRLDGWWTEDFGGGRPQAK